MNERKDGDFEFITLVICKNPMEWEIYPAALREQDIPHRTERKKDGSLVLMVPSEWKTEAEQALDRASQVFFGEARLAAAEKDSPREERDEQSAQAESGPFVDQDLPSGAELQLRTVWPVWALSALPGTGLGHLYAGYFQIFVYLSFASILGILFFAYTQSYFSFLLNLLAWVVDLGSAPYLLREHNRRAIRLRKLAAEMEEKILVEQNRGS